VQSAKSAAKTAFPFYPSLALEIHNPQSEIAVGVDFEHAPRLLGFVKARPRPDEREDEAVVYYDVVADAAFASAWPEHPRVAAAGGSGAATGPACRLAATHSW